MFRNATASIFLIIVCSGCTAAVEQTRDQSLGHDVSDGAGSEDQAGDQSPAGCIPAQVIEGVIQLHRVVVTLDAGGSDGVTVGMVGVLASGRPLKVISVDHATSRAVITGINLRIGPGTGACLFIEAH